MGAVARCIITGMNGKKYNLEAKLNVVFLNANDQQVESVESEHVTLQYFRVKTAETISEAQKLASAGKHQQAKNVLQAMVNIIWASKFKNIPISKALINDLNESMGLNTKA